MLETEPVIVLFLVRDHMITVSKVNKTGAVFTPRLFRRVLPAG